MNLNLSKVLKVGYKSKEKQGQVLKRYGYDIDNQLSNADEQVYYNKDKKKLLYNVTGSHSGADIITDGFLALGHLKDTTRYKNADEGLKKAKAKYNVQNATVTGHSLGASVVQGISGSEDKVFSLNGGYTIGQKTKGQNQHNYRTNGDVVSLFGARASNIKTIGREENKSILGSFVSGGLIGVGKNLLSSHKPETIRNQHIFV